MAMNLIQVQNRLRDLPASDPRSMQMLTAFANGQNPQVPPFIALAELNRRKQLAQKQTQPPEATVKDKIEQEAKMMQTNAGRQQEAMQNMGQQAMMANAGKIPASTPQTQGIEEESFAAGGIANLNSKFDFAGGGIVAFSGKDEKNDPETGQQVKDREKSNEAVGTSPAGRFFAGLQPQEAKDYEENQRLRNELISKYGPKSGLAGLFMTQSDEQRQGAKDVMGRLNTMTIPELQALSAQDKKEAKPKTENKPIADLDVDQKAKVETPAMTAEEKVRMLTGNRTPAGAPAGGGTRPAGGAPAGGDIYNMMVKNLKDAQFEEGPDVEKFMEEQRAKNPDMQGKAGGKLETLIEEIRRQDMADRAENKAREEARKSNRFLDVLTSAGQGMGRFKGSDQRGKSGVLNLLGGIGQQYKAMGEEDVQRSKEQRALQRQQDLAYSEMIGRIEDVRRAEATGNAKDILKAKQDAVTAKQNWQKSQAENLSRGATTEEQRRHNRATEDYQRSSLSQQGRDLIRERAALLAMDKANQGKTPTELLQMAATLGTGVQADNAETARFKAVAAAWKDSPDGKQEMLAAFDPKSQKYKDLAIAKEKFFRDNGVNLGGITGGGGGGGGGGGAANDGFGGLQKVK
jgi:hypothetical protein